MKKGDSFTYENTWVKRPGTGKILAARLRDVIGRKAVKDIPSDVHVQPGDVDGY